MMSTNTQQGFDQAVGEAKRQAAKVADVATVAAQLKCLLEVLSRISPILLSASLSASDGYLVGCIGRCSRLFGNAVT
jgi:hypothetical protein